MWINICTEFPHTKKNGNCCVFECFQSHCHILKKLHEFVHMVSAIIIFEKK
jgi:hypothetical protein